MELRRSSTLVLIVVATLSAVAVPRQAVAQEERTPSHWGVAVSVTPAVQQAKLFEDLVGTIDLQGTEFTIGVARGRTDGGDWAISLLKKKVKDGSLMADTEIECIGEPAECFRFGDESFTRDVTLTALEARKSVVFKTFAGRVQVGIDFAGGFGSFSGELEKHSYFADFIPGPQGGTMVQAEEVEIVPAKGNLVLETDTVPIGRFHVAVGVIVAPGVKIRASGGIGFPMNNVFTLTGVYLFGAR